MKRLRVLLIIQVLYELSLYDLITAFSGFDGVRRRLIESRVGSGPARRRLATFLCEAVNLGTCFYFKRVRCLQRAVVTVRLLRKYGIPGHVVIGCRPSPFLAHAWAEVDGQVVNDSQGYAERLQVLCKL